MKHQRFILVYTIIIIISACNNRTEKNLKIGKEMLAKKNYTEAKKYFDFIINDSASEDSLLYEAYFFRGVTNDSLNNQIQAFKDYSKALELNKSCAECYYNIGMVYWWDSLNHKKAIECFSNAINIQNNYYDAYIGRANAYYGLNKIENAICDFNKAINICPDSSSGYFQRGLFYKNIGENDSAINDFINAIKYDRIYNTKEDPYYFLIPLLSLQERNDEAIKYLSLAIKKYPQSSHYYSQRGSLHYTIKKYNEAINDLTKAIEIDPNDGLSFLIRAFVYLDLKLNDKACNDLNKAKQLNIKYAKEFFEDNCQ